jgi:hypothetical protein
VSIVLESPSRGVLFIRGNTAAASARAGASSVVSSSLLKGQWQPIGVPRTLPERTASVVSPVKAKTKKRPRTAAAAAEDDDAVPLAAVTVALGKVFSLYRNGGLLFGASSQSTDDALAFDEVSRGNARHIFSHVIVEADVRRWRLRGDHDAAQILDACAAAAGSGSEARWVKIPEDLEALGCTTYMLRLLHAVFKDDAKQSPDAWQGVISRWAKCGLKV